MADLRPNDLSHLSDEEFNALCPQGEHAPGPEPLSPTAQAVLDAAFAPWETTDTPQSIAAAAIRRAAGYLFINDTAMQCYDRLLAIATELEGHG